MRVKKVWNERSMGFIRILRNLKKQRILLKLKGAGLLAKIMRAWAREGDGASLKRRKRDN